MSEMNDESESEILNDMIRKRPILGKKKSFETHGVVRN